MKRFTRDEIAQHVARDIPEGCYVNLGIGLPTLVANHLEASKDIFLHSENGILGMGPAPAPGEEDGDLINAGKLPVTLLTGGTYFHQADSFAMMRGGIWIFACSVPFRSRVRVISRTGTRVLPMQFRPSVARWIWRRVPSGYS
jgi:3-oxoacid CoA-transferase B subunit